MNIVNIKKAIFIGLISMVISAPVYSGEEILLAAAIGSSTSQGRGGALGSGRKKDDDKAAIILPATSSGSMSTANMIALGIIGAGAVAAIANAGSTSTSNH